MRDKIYLILNRMYGVILTVSFFAGILPLVPFIIAICIGGSMGEAISVFLYKQYYPWIISAAAVSVVIGWLAMYIKTPENKSEKKATK